MYGSGWPYVFLTQTFQSEVHPKAGALCWGTENRQEGRMSPRNVGWSRLAWDCAVGKEPSNVANMHVLNAVAEDADTRTDLSVADLELQDAQSST